MKLEVNDQEFKGMQNFNEFTYPTNNFILNMILGRIHKKNQNFVAVFTGQTGSGKSYSALRLAELLMKAQGREFDTSNIVFNADDFKKKNNEDMPKGSIIIFDEAGVTWESHTALSSLNRELKKIMMTNRFKNLIYFITLPLFGSLDKSGRSLSHYSFQCSARGIDRKRGLSYIKPKSLVINYFDMNEGIIGVYEKFRHQGKSVKCNHMVVKKPSTKLLRSYEEKKLLFVRQLDAEVVGELGLEGKPDDVSYGLHDPDLHDPKVMIDPEDYAVYQILEEEPSTSRTTIAKVLGRSTHFVSSAIGRIRKKGFECPPGLKAKTQEYIIELRNKRMSDFGKNDKNKKFSRSGDSKVDPSLIYKEMVGEDFSDKKTDNRNYLTL